MRLLSQIPSSRCSNNPANYQIARLLFTIKNQKMILLHSFIKKSQKTPNKELEIAQIRLKNLQG